MIWEAVQLVPADLAEFAEDPDGCIDRLTGDGPEDPARRLDLDKAWHAIHWLLTGSIRPDESLAAAAIMGGEPVGADLGYGPARLLAAEQVQAVSRVLQDLSATALRFRFDPDAMAAAGVYPPDIWAEPDVWSEYLAPNIEALRAFYRDAAEAGRPVLQSVC